MGCTNAQMHSNTPHIRVKPNCHTYAISVPDNKNIITYDFIINNMLSSRIVFGRNIIKQCQPWGANY